jgi:hypothetical protein
VHYLPSAFLCPHETDGVEGCTSVSHRPIANAPSAGHLGGTKKKTRKRANASSPWPVPLTL